MVWVRLDDRFAEHPKVLALTDKQFRFYIESLCYAGRNTTDGRIPEDRVDRRVVRGLVAAGLVDEKPDGYWIHDFLDYNRSREQLENKRQAARRRMRNVRAKFASSSPNPGPARPGTTVPKGTGSTCAGTRPPAPSGSGEARLDMQAAVARIVAAGCGEHHVDQYVRPLSPGDTTRLAKELEAAVAAGEVEDGKVGAWVFRWASRHRSGGRQEAEA